MNQFGSLPRSDTGVSMVMTSKHPEPYIDIAAQALVKDSCSVHCGMVRKENKIKKWQDRYLVLHKGCLYYYKDSNDKTAQGQFSLSGYSLCKAPEKTKYEWTFRLKHIQPEKRSYYFAAHSEKELNEWIEKIQEDISQYCEIRRPHHTTDSSSEENDEKYDYPLVAPEDFDVLKQKMIKESRNSVQIASSSSEAAYCPPSDIFGSSVKPNVFPPKPFMVEAPSPSTGMAQMTVDISRVIGKRPPGANQAATNMARILGSQPPKPPVRKRPGDMTAGSPLAVHKPAILPKPRKMAEPSTARSESSEEMYLELNNDNSEEQVQRPSTLQRNRPDGHSFKVKDTEVPYPANVLPSSALRLDFTKANAIPLLGGYDGAYMIHSSRKGDINQALSVCIADKVKHFLIFCNKEVGVAPPL
ncbi:SH3 domain-binding protein 2, partial [Exaiptasia diaphana]|uniref:PH domain-containing protein n=1 Tax=Exaiptasia diaphana TaxID=2652724 RepID=A0A913YC18_EXADI